MFGVLTVVTMLTLVFSYPVLSELKAKARKILLLAMLNCCFGWAVFLAVWVEQGHFQAATVMLFLSNMFLTRCQAEGTLIFLRPMMMTLKRDLRSIERILWGYECFNGFGQLVLGIALIVFTRDVNPNRYNSVMVVFLFLLALVAFSLGLTVYIASVYLKAEVNSYFSSKDDVKMKAFVERLDNMKATNLANCLFSSMLFAFPLVSVVLGSFPGQYVLFFVIHIGLPIFTLQAAQLLRLEEHSPKPDVEQESRESRVNVGPSPSKQNNNQPLAVSSSVISERAKNGTLVSDADNGEVT
jgi:hypothetical protein